MNEAQKKVLLAIQKKEKELMELREKEKQINKKAAEKEKRAEEARIKKLGRRLDDVLKSKYGNRYFEETSMEEILNKIDRFAEMGNGAQKPAHPALPAQDENEAVREGI